MASTRGRGEAPYDGRGGVTEYDLKAGDLREWVWLVDSAFYRAHANLVKGYYKAGLATKATAADKWVEFRYNTKDIAWVVEEMLKRL